MGLTTHSLTHKVLVLRHLSMVHRTTAITHTRRVSDRLNQHIVKVLFRNGRIIPRTDSTNLDVFRAFLCVFLQGCMLVCVCMCWRRCVWVLWCCSCHKSVMLYCLLADQTLCGCVCIFSMYSSRNTSLQCSLCERIVMKLFDSCAFVLVSRLCLSVCPVDV